MRLQIYKKKTTRRPNNPKYLKVVVETLLGDGAREGDTVPTSGQPSYSIPSSGGTTDSSRGRQPTANVSVRQWSPIGATEGAVRFSVAPLRGFGCCFVPDRGLVPTATIRRPLQGLPAICASIRVIRPKSTCVASRNSSHSPLL